MLNRVKSTEYSRETTVVYTYEYSVTLPMVGISQMPRLIARCLPITRKFSLHLRLHNFQYNSFEFKLSHCQLSLQNHVIPVSSYINLLNIPE
mgnify:CR=1 FL=1